MAKTPRSSRTQGPAGACRTVIRPGEGRNYRLDLSIDAAFDGCAVQPNIFLANPNGSPSAMRNWACTRSIPVTISTPGVPPAGGYSSRENKSCAAHLPGINRPGIAVLRGLGRTHRSLTHLDPQVLSHQRRWGFLHHLLMAPLDRALALAEVDYLAIGVGQDLNFNVARVGDIFFDRWLDRRRMSAPPNGGAQCFPSCCS